MAINATELEAIAIQATTAYQKGLASPLQNIHKEIATPIKMTHSVMKAPIAKMVGPVREWIGPRVAQQLSAAVYTVEAKKYEGTVEVEREDIEDDQTGTLMVSFESLGQSAADVPEQLVFAKLAAGETDLCYDSKAFFATDHPEAGSTYANLAGSGSAPWYVFDVSKVVKPIVLCDYISLTSPEFAHMWNPTDPNVFNLDKYVSGYRCRGVADFGFPQMAYKHKGALDASNFESVITAMMSRKNDAGGSLGIGSQGFLVVVPVAQQNAAKKLFGREFLSGGEQNIHNGIRWVTSYKLANS